MNASADLDERRLALLECFTDAWNAHDVDALMACMSENCAFNASAGSEAEGTRYVGIAAVRSAYASIFEAFPDAAWTNSRHIVSGNTGLSYWRFVGTKTSGEKVEVDGCDIFAFDGDRIALKDSYRKARS